MPSLFSKILATREKKQKPRRSQDFVSTGDLSSVGKKRSRFTRWLRNRKRSKDGKIKLLRLSHLGSKDKEMHRPLLAQNDEPEMTACYDGPMQQVYGLSLVPGNLPLQNTCIPQKEPEHSELMKTLYMLQQGQEAQNKLLQQLIDTFRSPIQECGRSSTTGSRSMISPEDASFRMSQTGVDYQQERPFEEPLELLGPSHYHG